MGVLKIKLVKVEALQDSDGIGKSDPYVKFELEQDNMIFDKDFGKQESTKKSNTLNPEYNEDFEFADLPTLNNMVLSVRIMDEDIGLDDQIGFTKIELENLGLDASPKAINREVDKKKKKQGCTLNPCKLLCRCCCGMCCGPTPATVYLLLSYEEE